MIKSPYTSMSSAFEKFSTLYGEDTQFQRERYNKAFDKFCKSFGENSAYVASSSGRVEVVGNHTDHNGGKVICASISLDSLAMFMPTTDDFIYIASEGYKEFKINLKEIKPRVESSSKALVEGVCYALKKRGYKVGGFKAYITSNVIGGAGISSSASFEVLIAEILNFLYNEGKVSDEEKSYIAQYAEREFFGKPCGLLDQSAIAYGGLNKIDFSNPDKINVTKINNKTDFTFILINTGGSHANLTAEYASIPLEMKEVAKALGAERLIEISKDKFYNSVKNISKKVSDRAICRAVHFYTENDRVDSASVALENGDFTAFVNQINGSGASSLNKLQNCYVAGSTEQLIPKCIALAESCINGGGLRIHGGGFAGCVLAIVKPENLDKFVNDLTAFYSKDAVIPLKLRTCGAIVL